MRRNFDYRLFRMASLQKWYFYVSSLNRANVQKPWLDAWEAEKNVEREYQYAIYNGTYFQIIAQIKQELGL